MNCAGVDSMPESRSLLAFLPGRQEDESTHHVIILYACKYSGQSAHRSCSAAGRKKRSCRGCSTKVGVPRTPLPASTIIQNERAGGKEHRVFNASDN